jgi:hypothetical protein
MAANAHWVKNRSTHAWGSIGIGVALIIGTVPLARTLYPNSSAWWTAPGLFLGAVLLLFGMVVMVLPVASSDDSTQNGGADPVVEPQDPSLVIVDLQLGRIKGPVHEDEHPVIPLYTALWVTNAHPTESIKIMKVRIDDVIFDGRDRNRLMGFVGFVWEGKTGNRVPPIEIEPRGTIEVGVSFEVPAHVDNNGNGLLPGTVQATLTLIDQFNHDHQSGRVLWS